MLNLAIVVTNLTPAFNFDLFYFIKEDFMKRVELDAAERRDRKQRNNELANELKEKGNKAFKRKDFEEAIRYYDEAISVVKDNTILYTNRAQVWCLFVSVYW